MAAAVVGGVAYHVGKKGAQASQQEDEQNQAIADLQAQQQAPQQQYAEPAPAAAGGGITEQLTQLKGLLDSGVLSQDEFDAAKAKVLAGG
jgi:membrane protease subunit (stomatin/prohibitin family)